jgi:hypothetical protein
LKAILNWVFDPVNGYITPLKEMHTAYSGQKGGSDFYTFQYIGTNRRLCLITQCKKPTTWDKIWKEAREQLDYRFEEDEPAKHICDPHNAELDRVLEKRGEEPSRTPCRRILILA